MVIMLFIKKMARETWRSKAQFLALIIIVTMGVMFFVAINSIHKNLKDSSDKFYKDRRFAHLTVSCFNIPEDVVRDISNIPSVEKVSGRIVKDLKLEINGTTSIIRMVTLPDSDEEIVNDILITSGSYFSAEKDQCIVDEQFFNTHKLKLGDKLKVKINGVEESLSIVGASKSPEFVYQLRDGSQLMPDNKKFGVIYVKESKGKELFNMKDSINNIAILLEDEKNIEEAKKEIQKTVDKYGLIEIAERKNNSSDKMLKAELDELKSLGGAVPVVFYIVALSMMFIIMGRIIETQRAQIGILKAIGYGNGTILSYYISFTVLVGVIGGAVGSVLGMFLGQYFTEIENQFFHLPLSSLKMYPELVLPSVAITILFCILVGYFSSRSIYKILPNEAMKPKAPKGGKKIFIERFKKFWSNLDYKWKITFRNIFRSKKRTLLTAAGVIMSSAVVVVGFGLMDSINYMIDTQMMSSLKYEIRADFTNLASSEELKDIENIDKVKSVEPILETAVRISKGSKSRDVRLTASPEKPQLNKIINKKAEEVILPKEGIIIPKLISADLNIKEGDIVKCKFYYPKNEEKEVKVSKIIEQYMGYSVYCSIDSFKSFIDSEKWTASSALIKVDKLENKKAVEDALKDKAFVRLVETKDDRINNMKDFLGVMTLFTVICFISAAVLSMAVIYNISSINIFERERDYSTLKLLGYKDKEIKGLMLRENMLLTAVASIIGLPIGYFLNMMMLSAVKTEDINFPNVITIRSYLLSIIMILVFAILSNLVVARKISKVDIMETMKERE